MLEFFMQIEDLKEKAIDLLAKVKEAEEEKKELEKEKKLQQAILAIQKKHGKNALLKGMNLEEGATTRDRNGQIGGHKA